MWSGHLIRSFGYGYELKRTWIESKVELVIHEINGNGDELRPPVDQNAH